jgi:dolichol-phosphate mannosyltransferase
MPSPHKTLVTVATYNEIENVPLLVAAIHEQVPHADILVIDDNSPDGTGQWCDAKHEEDPRVRCLHRAGKLGLGTALIAGMNYAMEHDYEYMLNMDADFSHHPRYISAMLGGMTPTEGPPRDCMIGSRYVAGGGTEGWPLKRRLMSRMVNFYARLMLGLKTKDNSGAYRCYRVAVLRKLDLASVRSRGYSFQEEILWHLKRAGARFAETPIVFADRERGQSKIHGGEALAALWILFRLGVKNWTGL